MSSEGGGGGGVLRELLAVFGVELDTKGLKEGENKLAEFGEGLKRFGEALAGAFLVDQIYEFAEANVHAMTAIEHSAAQIGLTTDAVQAWQYAAKSAGFEAEKFTTAMSRLQVAQDAAIHGTGKGGNAFHELGINVKDSSGKAKTAEALFTDVAEAIRKTEDPTKRAGIATKLFGRSGRELIPFLEKGADGIGELLKKYHELGGGYTDDAIEKSKAFEEQQADLNAVWTRTKSIISSALLPVLTKIGSWVVKAISWFNALTKDSKLFQAALVALGVAGTIFAIKMAIAFAPLLLAAAAVAGLVLVLDDLMVLFSGGNSAIGNYIDKIFGKGTSTQLVHDLKETWQSITSTVKELIGYIDQVWEGIHRLTKASEDFGDKLAQHLEVGVRDFAYSVAHPGAKSTQEAMRKAAGYMQEANPDKSAPPPVAGIGTGGNTFNFEINGDFDSEDKKKKLAQDIGDHVDRKIKKHTREAMVNLPRAAAQSQ